MHGRFRESDLLRQVFENEPCRAIGPSENGKWLRVA